MADARASSSSHSKRGYRLCDQCGAVERLGAKFQLCGGCMTTQYCDCQRQHWAAHKPICQHTSSQLRSFSTSQVNAESDENLTKYLRKFTSTHTTLLSWAGYQALRVPLHPTSIRTHAFLIELSPSASSNSKSKFTVSQTHIVPISYVRDALVIKDIQRRDERCRAAGGLGAMVVLVQCGPVSQVMPVEIDQPETVGWGIKEKEEWERVLRQWVESGRGEFRGY